MLITCYGQVMKRSHNGSMDFLADEAQALKPSLNNQEQTEVHLFRLSQFLVWQITVKNKPDKTTLKPMNTKNFNSKLGHSHTSIMSKVKLTVLRFFVQPLKFAVENVLTCTCRIKKEYYDNATILSHHFNQYNSLH